MQRLSLVGGSWQARAPQANAQQCINYYPERNSADGAVQVTHYQRPGHKPLVQGQVGEVRGIFRASNGTGYAIIGSGVYHLTLTSGVWALALLGSIGTSSGIVGFTDNGVTALICDGSTTGYTITLASQAFVTFVDGTGTFTGATHLGVIDGFITWNFPGTNKWGSTLDFELTIDPLYVATKANYPDAIQGLIVNHHEIVFVGNVTSETWYDAGNTGFPFAELPGADHEQGTAAPRSIASSDTTVFFLGRNRQGTGVVIAARGYEAKRISNHAVEYAIRLMKNSTGITDAIGMCFQQDGHWFYLLTFPSGDQTWVYDEVTTEWHQWAWTDLNGVLHRARTNAYANLYDRNIVGDWQNGWIYELDPLVYSDTVAGVTYPISFIRSFPHVQGGEISLGLPGLTRPVQWAGQRVKVSRFVLDMQLGSPGAGGTPAQPAQIALSWSIDRGNTFQQIVLQPAGLPGSYATQPQWSPIGIGRDFVFRIEHQLAGEAALNGAWIEAEVLAS